MVTDNLLLIILLFVVNSGLMANVKKAFTGEVQFNSFLAW